MNQDDFQRYKAFNHKEDAEAFTSFLDSFGIENSLETIGNVFDTSITGKAAIANFLVKISAKDFEKVNALLIEEARKISVEDLAAHHLNLLDNEELQDIFVRPDDWAMEDVEIARLILKSRGEEISKEQIQSLRNHRISEINQGKNASPLYMFLSFSAIVLGFFSPFLLIPAGLGMAYYYAYGKNTDPNGNSYYAYNEKTRERGKWIFYIGIIILIIEVIFILKESYEAF